MLSIIRLRLLVLATAAGVVSSCTSPPDRNPVPMELVDDAIVPGMPGVRVFGDADPNPAQERESMQELAAQLHSTHSERPERLHWLAMSGGAADGAFGAGLLCGWTEAGTRPEFQIVTGVSTGALTAPFVFLGTKYDADLEHFYTELRADEVVRKRGLFSIIGNVSLADSTPLRELLEKLVTAEMLAEVAREHERGRRLIVATSNLDADQAVLWNLGRIAQHGSPEALRLFHDVLLASASVPGVFPPVFIDVDAGGGRYEEMHVDGGIHNQVTLLPPAFEIRDALKGVGLDLPIELWVIRNRPVTPEYEVVEAEMLAIMSKSATSTTRSQGIGDVYRLYLIALRDQLGFHLAAIPEDFREPREEEFDPVYMRKLFDRGAELGLTGEAWVESPPGFEPGQVVSGAAASAR